MQVASSSPSQIASAAANISRVTILRASMLVGCVCAVAGATAIGHPDTFTQADPDLGRLLRGMALIKAVIALAAVVAVTWRLGWPASNRATGAYVLGAWLVTGSSMLIWQLSFIPAAAIAFHVGAFAIVIAAWRDDKVGQRLARPNPAVNADVPDTFAHLASRTGGTPVTLYR